MPPHNLFHSHVETSRDILSKQGTRSCRLKVDQNGVKRHKDVAGLMKMDESHSYGFSLNSVHRQLNRDIWLTCTNGKVSAGC